MRFLCYAMVYVVKDKNSATVDIHAIAQEHNSDTQISISIALPTFMSRLPASWLHRNSWKFECSEAKHRVLPFMLHCMQILTNTWEVTMQLKRVIGKAILHKLPIYHEYMCLCWVSTLFGLIWLFFICNQSSTTRFLSGFIMFYLRCKCATFLFVPVLLAMQCNKA